MNVRRTAIGLSLLCALAVSAFAAEYAGAGQTAYVCRVPVAGDEPVGEKFSDAHCKTPDGSGTLRHVTIGVTQPVPVTVINSTTGSETSPAILQAVVGGLNTIIEAKKVSGSGTLENHTTIPFIGTMYFTLNLSKLTFEEVSVTNRKCTFTGIPGGVGKVETEPITATSLEQEDSVKFGPTTGSKFAEFELSGAECPAALKGKYPLFGSFKTNSTSGATATSTQATVTGEKTLRLKNATEGPVAGLQSTITFRNSAGEPIAFTT